MNANESLIAIDLDGGDKAPDVVFRGIRLAIKYGFVKPRQLRGLGLGETVSRAQRILGNVSCLEAGEKIDMGDPPMEALRRKRSSIHQGLIGVENGEFSAFVSIGNTAGVMAVALKHLKKLQGKQGDVRPGIAVPLPNATGPCLLLDAGALHAVKPESLINYARMGSIYVESVWGISRPIVRLVNIGEESCKGDLSLTSAYSLLSQADDVNFGGNIEPDRIFIEPVNVVVCPGLIGNMIIKTGEGVLNYLGAKFGPLWKIMSFLHAHHKRMDAKEIGGAICLGFDGIVIIGHGKSDPMAVANAIRRARLEVEANITGKIKERLLS